VHPVTLGHTRLKVTGNVFDMTLASWVESRAEATSPVLAFSEKLDYFLGMGASFTTMALLVMLIERVGSPKAAVASRLGTRVLAPALVKLVLMALPVVLALEACFTGGAPIDVGLTSCTNRGTHRAKTVHGTGRGNRKRCL
jgi:hypothetical protein